MIYLKGNIVVVILFYITASKGIFEDSAFDTMKSKLLPFAII